VRTGTFVGHTLGNLIGAQPMERPRRDLPDLAAGELATLLGWLREQVHRRKLIRRKFAGLYGL